MPREALYTNTLTLSMEDVARPFKGISHRALFYSAKALDTTVVNELDYLGVCDRRGCL